MSFLERIVGVIGKSVEFAINSWVKVAGKRVRKAECPWLRCPMRPKGGAINANKPVRS